MAELALRRLTTLRRATDYLNTVFIPRYGRRFGRAATDPRPAWRPLPADLDLKAVLCAKSCRTVANDPTVRFGGWTYQLLPPPRCPSLARASMEVQEWFDGTVHFCHARYGVIVAKRLYRQGKRG